MAETDLISRQAAIDAINKAFERVFAWDGTSPLGDKVLENVPSAQPELSDEESELIYRIGYEKGKLDGVKNCTERLKKMNDSFCAADGDRDMRR